LRRRSRWILAAALVIATAATGGAVATAAPVDVTLYLSVDGRDDANGDADSPLRTLSGARDRLAQTDSETATILVRPGTYRETATVDWSSVPQSKVTIQRASGTERPVFDGSQVTGKAQYWVDTHGGPALDVWGMLVRNYQTGGLRLDTDGNHVRNMIFEKIGNRHKPGGPGYAAVHMLGSSNNSVINNVFRDLENDDCGGCVHALYIANDSDGSVITGNRISDVIGDPIRLRNGTDGNVISDNEFSRSGGRGDNRAFVSFWVFRDTEVCGGGNLVTDNRYDGRRYDGSTGQPIAGSGAEPGLARCPSVISESGNVKT